MSLTITQLDSLIQSKYDILQNIISQLAEITLSPKPTYSCDGQTVSWESFQNMLFDAQDKEIKAIEQLQKMYNVLQPFQMVSRGR